MAPAAHRGSIGERVPAALTRCRICGSTVATLGVVFGKYSGRDYQLDRCAGCGYAFIADPWLDYAAIYDERYYAGRGADPMVDYEFELNHPRRTIRCYEWQGIAAAVESVLQRPLTGVRWLDYGCGNGGLVRSLRGRGCDAAGFEEGSITTLVRAHGIPLVGRPELAAQAGVWDVVSAIEVLEHTLDPVAELRAMRAMLRPGGLLFLTTGNAAPFRDRLLRWSYVIPEIHVSFFEPRTLELALRLSGFDPQRLPRSAGFDQILKFKVLKNLRLRQRSSATDLIPARLLGTAGDRAAHLSEHPVGWAR